MRFLYPTIFSEVKEYALTERTQRLHQEGNERVQKKATTEHYSSGKKGLLIHFSEHRQLKTCATISLISYLYAE